MKLIKVEHIGGRELTYRVDGKAFKIKKGETAIVPVGIYNNNRDRLAKIRSEEKNKQSARYNHVERIIGELKPKIVIEIGILRALTAKRMIRAMLSYMDKPLYIGFDLFEPSPEAEGSKKGVESLRLVRWRLSKLEGARVRLIKGDTNYTLPAYNGPKADFIFIDGGHSLDTIKNDFVWSARWLKEGGIILMDDYYSDKIPCNQFIGCKTLVDSLKSPWKYEILEPADIVPRDGSKINMVKIWRAGNKL